MGMSAILLIEGGFLVESNNHREIIVKTTCGRGSKVIEYVQYLELPKEIIPERIMGCTITNVEQPKALKWKVPEKSRYYVPVKGAFEVHAWYAYNNGHDTAVGSASVVYHENIPIQERSAKPVGLVTASAKIEDAPKIAEAKLEGNKIRIVARIEISAEVVGDSRLMVEVVE